MVNKWPYDCARLSDMMFTNMMAYRRENASSVVTSVEGQAVACSKSLLYMRATHIPLRAMGSRRHTKNRKIVARKLRIHRAPAANLWQPFNARIADQHVGERKRA